MGPVRPFLWFDDQAQEAAQFYTSILPNSRVISQDASSATFSLGGQEYIAFNGGPHFKFSPAISLFVNCQTQEEVDLLWDKLCAGGEAVQCGWLKDKFGLSWQIVPAILPRLLHSPDPVRSGRVKEAMLKMIKLDIASLQAAYDGEE